MTSVRIIYDVEGWAFYHQAMTLKKYAGPDLAISFGCLPGASAPPQRRAEASLECALGSIEPDIVFLLTATRIQEVGAEMQRRGWRSRLVSKWTDGAPRRLDVFERLYPWADAWVINNLEYWNASGRRRNTHMIANGVDLDVFRPVRPLRERAPRVLWVGSQLHRSLKGYDEFILPLWAELERDGIACEARLVDSYGSDKLTPAEMAEWYNHGTVLVCASQSEGTPNPALEAAACGCTIVSTRVGNMPELIESGVNGFLVERELNALAQAIRAACADHPRLATAMLETIRVWDWQSRANEFFDLFHSLAAATPTGRERSLESA